MYYFVKVLALKFTTDNATQSHLPHKALRYIMFRYRLKVMRITWNMHWNFLNDPNSL